jgi:hypothetical protein
MDVQRKLNGPGSYPFIENIPISRKLIDWLLFYIKWAVFQQYGCRGLYKYNALVNYAGIWLEVWLATRSIGYHR